MKRLFPLIFLTITLALAQPLPEPEQEEPPPPEREPREWIETLRKVRLIDELRLSEEQITKFFPKLNELKETREQFNQQRRELIDELADLLAKGKKSIEQINAKLDKLFNLEEEFHKRETVLRKELRKILTPEQQIRFILFQTRFDDELRQMIQRVRKLKEIGPKRLKERRRK